MRLIDKNEVYRRFFDGGNGIARIHVAMVDEIPEVSVPSWISVHDKLPDKIGHYLCTNGKEVIMCLWDKCSTVRFIDGQNEYYPNGGMAFVENDSEYGRYLYTPTHWMPLPEPPKE